MSSLSVSALDYQLISFPCRALNSNRFNGNIPHTIGNLSNIIWLDLSDNQLEGTIPTSNDDDNEELGLDKLLKAKHLYVNAHSQFELIISCIDMNGIFPVLCKGSKTMSTFCSHLGNNRLSGGIPANLFSPDMSLLHV